MSIRVARLRHALVAATLSAVSIGLIAPSAIAAPDKGNATDADTESVNQEITGTLLINGDRTKLVDLAGVTQLVDGLGRALGSPRTVALKTAIDNPDLGEYSCVYRGKGNKNFSALPVRELYQDYGYGKVQALFHTYRLAKARKISDGTRSVQFEVCGVGGGDMGDKRMRRVGIGIAYPDAASTSKIGSGWRSGETPENYTVELGFEAPVYKDITISGGISQTPTNKLMGSFEPPFPASTSQFARNAVNAWWQDDCVGGVPCNRFQGSKDFHGTVAQGLWEFSPAQTATFRGFTVSTFLSTN